DSMIDPLLTVEDVSFAYGELRVLFDISLHVERGEALALLGTNGAGKSTLLRVVSGLEKPASGRVVLDGRDVGGVAAEKLVEEGIILVPGGRAIFTDMTIDENLQMQALTVRKDRAWVQERREVVMRTFPRLAERL